MRDRPTHGHPPDHLVRHHPQQEEDLLLLRLSRHLWFYSAVFNFAGLQRRGSEANWPPEWRAALGRISLATPFLVVGSEQQKDDELQERLRSEFGSRLGKLPPAVGSGAALAAALTTVVSTPPGSNTPPAPLAAHLLTIAVKGLCRAHYSGGQQAYI